MNRAQLLQRVDEAWRELQASYEGLPETELSHSGVSGEWSIMDTIAHVTSWEEEALAHLPAVAAGDRPPSYAAAHGGIDAFNARVIMARRGLALSEVLRRRDDVHRKLIDYLKSVPEEQFRQETRFRHRLRLDTYGHYAKHAKAIWKWREQRSAR